MQRSPGVSPYGLLLLLAGAVMSTATTCGPPDHLPDVVTPETGPVETGTARDPGYTLTGGKAFDLDGAGSVATVTVHATLAERCLAEVPEYSWGYPTGWLVLGFELVSAPAPADTGGPDTGDTAVAAAAAETGGADTGATDSGVFVDTGAADTDTGGPGDTSSDGRDTAHDTEAGDSGGPDTGAIDTGAIDTGAVDTGAVDTGVVDTGDSGGDTGWGDSGDTGPDADARVLLAVGASDGSSLGEVRIRLHDGTSMRDSLTTERPFVSCGPDAICEVTWTAAFTLVEGGSVHGAVDAHVRLNMCSSGEPEETDLSVVVE